MYDSFAKVHREDRYSGESVALPENVLEFFKKQEGHSCVYTIDRGHSSTASFGQMHSKDGLLFVGRLAENRKYVKVRDFDLTYKSFSCDVLKEDATVQPVWL
jgi:hypothetical protein